MYVTRFSTRRRRQDSEFSLFETSYPNIHDFNPFLYTFENIYISDSISLLLYYRGPRVRGCQNSYVNKIKISTSTLRRLLRERKRLTQGGTNPGNENTEVQIHGTKF